MSLLSNNSTVEKHKIDFERGLRAVTKLYSCTIIDVHPESLTVDVVVTKNSKLIEGVLIGSNFLGRDCANITIPERNTEAILASTEDSNPFIVAYRPTRSYKNGGYFSSDIQEGEAQTSYVGQSFKKYDAYGGIYKSSGNADWIIVSDDLIHNETKTHIISTIDSVDISVSEYETMSKEYKYSDLTRHPETLEEIVSNTRNLIDLTILNSNESIYGMLTQISEDNIDKDFLDQINNKIDVFLNKKPRQTRIQLRDGNVNLNSERILINNIDNRLFLKNFISSRVVNSIENRSVNGESFSANKSVETFFNSDNDTLYTITTFTFDDAEDYKEEELELPTGEVYLKKTWTNYYINGKHYDTYSETINKNLPNES